MSTSHPPQVLFFDVFGTVVDRRTSNTKALAEAAQHVLSDSQKRLSPATRAQAAAMTPSDWQTVADEWAAAYNQFTDTFDPSHGFVSVDQQNHTSLQGLLKKRSLGDLFTDKERWDLTLGWHRLDPRADSVRGLDVLNRRFRTCTLSNANVAILENLSRYGGLPFSEILSAEHFGAYKPSPEVYLGAAARVGVEPGQCAQVAAHLYDLKAAKGLGLQTIYVEREGEEEKKKMRQAREEGYVDMWIGLESEGLLEVARRFGL